MWIATLAKGFRPDRRMGHGSTCPSCKHLHVDNEHRCRTENYMARKLDKRAFASSCFDGINSVSPNSRSKLSADDMSSFLSFFRVVSKGDFLRFCEIQAPVLPGIKTDRDRIATVLYCDKGCLFLSHANFNFSQISVDCNLLPCGGIFVIRCFSMNTLKQGTYRWMIFKDDGTWVGVAMEFNIVITADDPRVVQMELDEAVIGYLESAKKIKGFRPQQVNGLLNQTTEKEYEDRWAAATGPKQPVKSPFSDIYKLGISSLANV